MTNLHQPFNITPDLARKLIAEQFPEYAHLPITSVEKQGHDNRTYRLGPDMLIRMPIAEYTRIKETHKNTQEFIDTNPGTSVEILFNWSGIFSPEKNIEQEDVESKETDLLEYTCYR